MPKQSLLHTELIRRAEILLRQIHTLWNDNVFQNVLFTWAGSVIKDDKGIPIDDVVGCDLPSEKKSHVFIARRMVDRTDACGILRIRREKPDVIKAIFETMHGTKSWTFPLDLRGDTKVIGSPTVKEDEDYLGVLWAGKRKPEAKEAAQPASPPTPDLAS